MFRTLAVQRHETVLVLHIGIQDQAVWAGRSHLLHGAERLIGALRWLALFGEESGSVRGGR